MASDASVQLYQFSKPKGELAKSWELSTDGKTYTFHLQPQATFHDGSPVTADDVSWSLARAVSLPTTRFVLNVGGLSDAGQVKVVDAKTVTVELREPNRSARDPGRPVGDRMAQDERSGRGRLSGLQLPTGSGGA